MGDDGVNEWTLNCIERLAMWSAYLRLKIRRIDRDHD